MQAICAEYGDQIWLTPSEEIRAMTPEGHEWIAASEKFRVTSFKMELICAAKGLETWLAPNIIPVLVLDMQDTCSEYGLHNWDGTTEEIRQ